MYYFYPRFWKYLSSTLQLPSRSGVVREREALPLHTYIHTYICTNSVTELITIRCVWCWFFLSPFHGTITSEIVSAIKSIVPCNKDLCGRTAWIDGKEQKVYDKGGIEGWVAIDPTFYNRRRRGRSTLILYIYFM